MTTINKRGPKPITGKAMSAAERKRRQRMKELLLIKAAEESGYTPILILLNKQQLKALAELEASWGGHLDSEKLNIQVFMALKRYLDFDCHSHLKTPVPEDCGELSHIQLNAKIKFIEWEEKELHNDTHQY